MNVPADAAMLVNTPGIDVPAAMLVAAGGKLVMLLVTALKVHAVRHKISRKSPVTAAVLVFITPPYSPASCLFAPTFISRTFC